MRFGLSVLSVLAAAPLGAQQVPSSQQLGVFVYPAKQQAPAQQKADEGECYGWARQQSGIDPFAPVVVQRKEDQTFDGSAVKGAAGGAAVGTAIGAIAGETGEGAAIGAVAGAVRGRRKAKAQKKQAEANAEQQAQAISAGNRETFNKAYSVCLEAKGYTVK
jgi:hypothetical protein